MGQAQSVSHLRELAWVVRLRVTLLSTQQLASLVHQVYASVTSLQKLPHFRYCAGQCLTTSSGRGAKVLAGVYGLSISTIADFYSPQDVPLAQLGRKVQGGVSRVSRSSMPLRPPSQKWAPHFSQQLHCVLF